MQVPASPEALRCVLEQDTLSSAKYWLTQEDPYRYDMTEKKVGWDVKNPTKICSRQQYSRVRTGFKST